MFIFVTIGVLLRKKHPKLVKLKGKELREKMQTEYFAHLSESVDTIYYALIGFLIGCQVTLVFMICTTLYYLWHMILIARNLRKSKECALRILRKVCELIFHGAFLTLFIVERMYLS